MTAHGLPLPHGHPAGLGVSVHVGHLLLVAMLAMLVVVIALV